MGRRDRISLWLGLAMAGFVVLTLVSWMALQAAASPGKFGAAGTVALRLASLPSVIGAAWVEAKGIVTGEEESRYLSVPMPDIDRTGFRPVAFADGTPLSELSVRGDVAAADRGWRLLGGAMELEGRVQNVAVLLDPDLTVNRYWRLHQEDVPDEWRSRDSRRLVHGLRILRDGSILFNFDPGSSVQRRDACNRFVWAQNGYYHHALTLTADGRSVWALRDWGFDPVQGDVLPPPGTGAVRLNLDTGAIEQEIGIADLMAANPGLGVFEIARLEENAVETNAAHAIGTWIPDPAHFNDVEPLTPTLATAFPQFEAGDLLLSARRINTVLVVDPETLKIKWHQTGGMLRQHDPDWRPDGTISVLDNAMGLGTSRILALDPVSGEQDVTFDGAKVDFYTRIRGKHSRTARGDLAIVSPQQGRAFELGPDGAPVLEFLNVKPGAADKALVISEYLWLPEAALELEPEEAPCTTD